MRSWRVSPANFAFFLLLLLSPASNPEAAPAYFHYVRDVTIPFPARQSYFVIYPEIWDHARPDLADLRLFDGGEQVPYALREERGRRSQEEREAKILNLGTVAGKTEFVVDVGDMAEYDRVRLRLETKDFVVPAQVSGEPELNRGPITQLGSTTLYDFSREGLGSNFVLKLPTSSFRYLHVKLAAGVGPEQVKGASVSNVQETKSAWMQVGSKPVITGKGKNTVVTWEMSERTPLDRVSFKVAASDINFRRSMVLNEVGAKQGSEVFVARDSISRVRITRSGNTANSESLFIDVPGAHASRYSITIENGDDRPLNLEGVEPLSIERRVYFDPQGKTSLRLYYGDEKLMTPVYDYDKFFQQDAHAASVQLGVSRVNPEYAGRPDERPWSERHQSVMWIAMLLAILGLAVVAVRGMKRMA